MKSPLIVALALFATAAVAQTTNFNQVPHIETALNHLTVIDRELPLEVSARVLAIAAQEFGEASGDTIGRVQQPVSIGVLANRREQLANRCCRSRSVEWRSFVRHV